MNKIVWIILAFVAGAFLPVQAGLNAKLGRAAGSPIHGSMLSFLVGAAGMILYVLLSNQTISWQGLREAPLAAWGGGLLGAFYVTVIIFAFPALGPGLTFGLVVAGQMIFSAVLEHYNILVSQPQPINMMRIFGLLLIVAGVIVLRKF